MTERLDQMSNPRADRVKKVARLAGRSARQKQNRFLAEGPQSVREALRAHLGEFDATLDGHWGQGIVEEIYVTDGFETAHPDIAALVDRARSSLEVRTVTDEVLDALSDAVTPQHIIAVCTLPGARRSLEWLHDRLPSPTLLAVLCRVQDPGNAGTIIRAADAAGADAVLLTSGSVDPFNPKTVRSTAGSLFHLPVFTAADLSLAADSARKHGQQILAADGYGDQGLETAGTMLAQPSMWLFGNEAKGLSEDELAVADARIAVPLYGHAESLNVATAATVCLYASAMATSSHGTSPTS
ncbi:MAG: TrmH family RNA methyltransferase [Micrococcaceae bacterium]